MLLSHDLQGISNTHGEDTRIAQRQPAIQNISDLHIFRKAHHDCGQNGAYKALNAVELHSIQITRQPVDDGDLNREGNGADDQADIADVHS